ncbi:hypothetical protein [Paenibacillus sp. SI8]|uniref:hypothetical protein n=1 Tax=unclassified Paenibacillus TaxID=185978 RepID=UPI003465F320
MLQKMAFSWLIILFVVSLLPSAAGAASGAVKVQVADFPVKVNGNLINNGQSEYPFIVYKDITYAPLNWDTLQELEISSEWSDSEGLKVYKICCATNYGIYPALEKAPYSQTLTAHNASNRAYTAHVADYPIELWGSPVKNEEETYPFLEFRNVTYMPLTWEFAHTRLMMDLQWKDEDGLAVWSGQDQVMQQIVYDDDEALYIDTSVIRDKVPLMMKVSKTLQGKPVWLQPDQASAIRDKVEKAAQTRAGQGVSVTVERKDNKLIYQGLELAALREEEQHILGETTLRIEGTLYEIDDKRKLLGVYTYFPIAVIGPPPNSRYQLFSIIDGKVRAVTEYPYLPQFVQKNTDGTVWIASERKLGRHFFYRGSGLLALMDQNGEIKVANDAWNEQDVSPIGLTSPTRNPVDPDGRMIVRLYGKPQSKEGPMSVDPSTGRFPMATEPVDAAKDGLYEVDKDLHLKRLSNAPDDRDGSFIYRDRAGDLFTINPFSNTITNWSHNGSRTWTDVELLKQQP